MLYTPAFFAMFTANLSVVASFTCFFLFPLFITQHGGDTSDIGLLMGVFALASALCRPWISPLIDRFGRKRCFMGGCLIMILMPTCYMFFDQTPLSIFPLSLVRVVHGIGLAICFTSVFTFIADYVPDHRLNEGIGLFGISGLLGIAIGPTVAEWLLQLYGFNGLFVAASILALTAMIVLLPIRDHSRDDVSTETAPGFFELLVQPRHVQVAVLAALFGFGVSTSGNFIAPLGEERHLALITPFFVCYSLAAVGTRLVVGRLADRVGERRVIPWSFLVCALGLLLVVPAYSPLMLALSGLACGAGHGLLFPTLNTLAIRDIPSHYRGRVTGIFTGSIDSGIFIGSVALGAIAKFIPLISLFVISAIIMLAGAAFTIRRKT